MLKLKSKNTILLFILFAATLMTAIFYVNKKDVPLSSHQKNENQKCDQIRIRNKTSNKFIKDECTIHDPKVINDYLSEISSLSPIPEVNVAANQGFYEVDFLLDNKVINEVEIIYTTYNGVIIETTDSKGYYKNDRLESLTLQFMQNNIECN